MEYKNLDEISIEAKQILLAQWDNENPQEEDISQRHVPVGVNEVRVKDFMDKVVYDLKTSMDNAYSLYQELDSLVYELSETQGSLDKKQADEIINTIAVLRISLQTAFQNLKTVSEKEGFTERIF